MTVADAVRHGRRRATDVVSRYLARIERHDPAINAYTRVVAERARARAADIDATVARGGDPGPLAGVPFAVKSLFDIRGEVTTAGAAITRDDPPAARDSVLVQRLEDAGAILLGAVGMGEFAYDFTGENAHYGPCRNPWDLTRMSGGSSSGSGAALAGDLALLTLGSDTNGSIRVPGSLCGVFGLKPTYGRLPRTGSYPFCDSLDHLGPMAGSTQDLALAYDMLQGHCPGDHACVRRAVEPTLPLLHRGIGALRVGIAGGYFSTDPFPDAARAMDTASQAFRALGCSPRTVEVPLAAEGRSAAFLITNAESAALHLEHLRGDAEGFDPDTRDRFLAGALMPAHWYLRAQALRRHYGNAVLEVFQQVDLLIAPATPCAAPVIGEKHLRIGGRTVGLRANLGYYTQPVSCIGLPVCCVPLTDPGPLPMGIQLIAPPWREDLCLRAAWALESSGYVSSHLPAEFAA